MNQKEYSLDIGGKTLTAQFTDLADQSHGSVIVRYGNTAVLATAVMSENERNDIDYFPLSVEYEEKFYAAGAILGSRFVRREGRPTDEAVLSGRVVDRTIRPLFSHDIRNEVQVVITILAIDEDDPDVSAVIAASLALGTSDIPWNGPVSAVRIGASKEGSQFTVNPTYTERLDSENALDLLVCGKDGLVNMIEVGADEISESEATKGLAQAVLEIEKIQAFQQKIIDEIGKEKRAITPREIPEEVVQLFNEEFASNLSPAVFSGPGKVGGNALKREWKARAKEMLPEIPTYFADALFEERVDDLLHEEALKNNRRADGRAMDEVRPLYAQAGGVSEIIHGTGIFYRGGTHIFSALTLGGPGEAQVIDTMEEQDSEKRFMHHYNFPPFSVGETGRVGGFNRRMIGHGALAEKALLPVIPPKNEFPYTIRIVSEAMASNGSTSMGSVCGSTLALMDGGVPIKRPVAGIAMGLMSDSSGAYKVLTDIQGPEDHHGDMDFKVAGTSEGITAVQMDVKVLGVPVPVLQEAFEAAKKARLQILDVITKEISTPRADISPRAPKILMTTVAVSQIGLVIGPGGKTINGIKDETGVEEISIEDDGSVFITGRAGSAEKALAMIEALTHEYKAGEEFEGEVTRILDFGAFVKIGPNAEGLVHISEIAPFHIEKVEGALSVGERVPVIIKEIDEKDRINLSIKRRDPEFATRKGLAPTESNEPRGSKQSEEN